MEYQLFTHSETQNLVNRKKCLAYLNYMTQLQAREGEVTLIWLLLSCQMLWLSDAVAVRVMNGTLVCAHKFPSLSNMGRNSAPLRLIT